MQLPYIAWAANSAKPRAKNVNSVLMAIPRQQLVPLQSEYLFDHGVPLSSNRKIAGKGNEHP
jgi:hypothetical protein